MLLERDECDEALRAHRQADAAGGAVELEGAEQRQPRAVRAGPRHGTTHGTTTSRSNE
jgi:hypothetical protein